MQPENGCTASCKPKRQLTIFDASYWSGLNAGAQLRQSRGKMDSEDNVANDTEEYRKAEVHQFLLSAATATEMLEALPELGKDQMA